MRERMARRYERLICAVLPSFPSVSSGFFRARALFEPAGRLVPVNAGDEVAKMIRRDAAPPES